MRRSSVCLPSNWMQIHFSLPITAYATSYFLTARLAARRMVARKSGVITTVTAAPFTDRHLARGRLRVRRKLPRRH